MMAGRDIETPIERGEYEEIDAAAVQRVIPF
jgi:hypothetical protein